MRKFPVTALILGVDRCGSEPRPITDFIGNTGATLVVAKEGRRSTRRRWGDFGQANVVPGKFREF